MSRPFLNRWLEHTFLSNYKCKVHVLFTYQIWYIFMQSEYVGYKNSEIIIAFYKISIG